jgi:diketogulonate reductase-like aldo/keto reductase
MAALHRALDLGANFFDTAASYDNGKSEKLTGQHLNNARVIAKGTDRTAFADQTGAFVLGFVQE